LAPKLVQEVPHQDGVSVDPRSVEPSWIAQLYGDAQPDFRATLVPTSLFLLLVAIGDAYASSHRYSTTPFTGAMADPP
jgi:hypothetical protein